ncbi:hypothetical protein [Saccharopolyspora gloriosae]|uniref:hypothetical protein n=1 Tax=Saccharopolyspora gloriosae TaxID=455344 RepID=UPI001FB61FC9|nr:hypothetical protein [Saccharopolyspora gloriosae]
MVTQVAVTIAAPLHASKVSELNLNTTMGNQATETFKARTFQSFDLVPEFFFVFKVVHSER